MADDVHNTPRAPPTQPGDDVPLPTLQVLRLKDTSPHPSRLHFFDLPVEIRLTIYEYAATLAKPVHLTIPWPYSSRCRHSGPDEDVDAEVLPMRTFLQKINQLQVSREFVAEALPVAHRVNHFRIDVHTGLTRNNLVFRWMDTVSSFTFDDIWHLSLRIWLDASDIDEAGQPRPTRKMMIHDSWNEPFRHARDLELLLTPLRRDIQRIRLLKSLHVEVMTWTCGPYSLQGMHGRQYTDTVKRIFKTLTFLGPLKDLALELEVRPGYHHGSVSMMREIILWSPIEIVTTDYVESVKRAIKGQ